MVEINLKLVNNNIKSALGLGNNVGKFTVQIMFSICKYNYVLQQQHAKVVGNTNECCLLFTM